MMETFAVETLDNFRYVPKKTGRSSIYIQDNLSGIGVIGPDDPGYTKNSLRRVSHLGSNITEILPESFKDCQYLEYVDIPDGILSVGAGAFANCINLTDSSFFRDRTAGGDYSEISCKVKYLGPSCFYNTGIRNICLDIVGTGYDYPDTISTFANCKELRSVKFTGKCPMYDYEFAGCTKLTSVTFPETGYPNWSGSHTFENCVSLPTIKFPSWYRHGIDKYMFRGCTSLTSIDMSEVVQTDPPDSLYGFPVGTGAFIGCTNLTSLTLPPIISSFVDPFSFFDYDCLIGCNISRIICPGITGDKIESSPKFNSGMGLDHDCEFIDKNGGSHIFYAGTGGGYGEPSGKYVKYQEYPNLFVDDETTTGFVSGHDVWYENCFQAIRSAYQKGQKICLMSTGGKNCTPCRSFYNSAFAEGRNDYMNNWMKTTDIIFLYDDVTFTTAHTDMISGIRSMGLKYDSQHYPCFNLYWKNKTDGIDCYKFLDNPFGDFSKQTAEQAVYKLMKAIYDTFKETGSTDTQVPPPPLPSA